MRKPILATNLDGFLIKSIAFSQPHKEWFKKMIAITKNKSLKEWIGKENYFEGINEAMKEIMPNATDRERTQQAREGYQKDVIEYIKTHPGVCYRQAAIELKKLRTKYTLALITSNSKEYVEKILQAARLEGIYDIIFATNITEKPSKTKVFKQFIKKHGKPVIYIVGKNIEVLRDISRLKIRTIYTNWEENSPKELLNLL